ncbi:ABC transporter substrate-binding protein [Caldanaerobius polysaccharolyticus]|uniref:ABC transporter substrate-binding protein n=1 Tax=Caldanaerobius polysaccharolyticus TaxID=44256 RepID=UPI00047E752A|nr:sugar ABC transporter substrate-binding protein [Caldanaerobius polysaccharolyticus]
MKKFLSIVLIFSILSMIVLAGCGQKGSTQATKQGGSSESKGPTKLTLWTFVGLHAQLYNDAAKRWNKEHPDQPIELKAVTYPYEDMHNKLLVALQSGVGAPDIADVEIGRFPQFLKGTPQLADLTDLVQSDKDKFIQSRLQIYSKDGKLYGMPTHGGSVMAFYNKELLDKAGIDPSKIVTWDDFVAAGKIVKAKTGKPMVALSQTAMWEFDTMIGQQGSDIFDENGNVILDSDVNVKTLQFMHDMIYKDQIAVVAPGGQVDTEQSYGWIDKGNVASVIMPFWYMSRFVSYMPDLKGKVLVAPVPVWKDGNKYPTIGLGGTGTVVPLQGKNVELAKKFLYFAKGTQEANLEIWNVLGFDPPRWDVWEQLANNPGDNKYTQYFVNGKDIFKILLSSTKGNVTSLRSTELNPTANDLLANQVLYKVLRTNKATPEQALKAAADELRKNKK